MSSLGQIAGGVVGGVVGFFAGNPLYGAQIGMMIGGAIDPPKGPTINGPRLSDLSVQTSTYGAFIPRNYGTMAQVGNVFWVQGNQLIEVVTSSTSGGKGGPKTTTNTASYYATFAVGLCEGPIDGVRRIWIGNQLWYDAGSNDMQTVIASNDRAVGFTLYPGTDTQDPDPLIQADKGVANVPAYRGLAYIVFDRLALAAYSNSLMGAQIKVEIVKSGSQAFESQVKTISNAAWPYNQWADVASNGSTMVATSLSSSLVAYSLDGENWTTSSMPSSSDWITVVYGHPSDGPANYKSLFVAIGGTSGKTAYSFDGMVWTAGTSLPALDFRKIHWNGAQFMAIAYGTTRMFTSPDGLAWTEHAFPTTASYPGWIDVAWNGSTYCAINRGNAIIDLDQVAVSVDGATWTIESLPVTGSWNQIESDGTSFVALTVNGKIAYSADGITWTGGSPVNITSGSLAGGTSYYRLAWNGSQYGISINSTLHYLISEDLGLTWAVYNGIQAAAFISNIYGVSPGVFLTVPFAQNAEYIYKRTSLSTLTLDSIVQAECLTSGLLTSSDLDVTELTDTVRGYRVTQLGAIRGGLDPLRAAFPFDVVQHGYQIKFKRRGSASVVSIDSTELDARAAGDAPGVQITTMREMDSVLPRRVSVNYIDVTREYDVNQQYAERLNSDSVSEKSVNLPIVFNADESAQKAETLLYLYWMERYDVSLRLPPIYAQIEPGDVITVTSPSADYELRLTSINTMPDGRLECAAKFNQAALYTPTAIGEEGKSIGGLLSLGGSCVYSLLDIPLLRDDDDTAGFPVAMSGYLSGWPGGVLYRSDDSGQTWSDLRAFAPGAVMGYATTSLAGHGGTVYDFASRLTIKLFSGTLASVTESQLFAGQNWFAYGADGRWEIIAARTATLQVNGSYILQDFLRGQQGTEWATGLHAINDRLVLLDVNSLGFISVNSSTIGATRNYRAITTGKAIDSDASLAFAYHGVNLECLSPVGLAGSRHPSTNDWSLSWTRRSRLPGWYDLVDVPLGETSESYEIDIYSNGSYTTLKRTLTASTPTVAYTSAQQVTDFGSNQATLYLKLYQLSATVGRGYALTQSLTR